MDRELDLAVTDQLVDRGLSFLLEHPAIGTHIVLVDLHRDRPLGGDQPHAVGGGVDGRFVPR